MNSLVILEHNIPLTTSLIIAKETELEHRSIFRMIKRYENDLNEFGVLRFDIAKPKTGRPLDFVKLNEEQTSLLIMYLKNTEKVRMFKKLINKQFHQYRKALLQIEMNRQNEEWISTRKDGKKSRKELTEAIKKLLEFHNLHNPESTYAKKPNLLYSNITRMIDKTLFDIQLATGNKRDCMTKKQLTSLDMVEIMLSEKIYEYIDNGGNAKQIYKLLQEDIKPFVEWIGGKSTIIDLITGQQISMLG